jgi:hypothetical protein
MDFPAYSLRASPIVTYANLDSMGSSIMSLTQLVISRAASTTWPSNNLAFYYPFSLTSFETAYQLLFLVGATSSGNIDVGIYDSQKNRIVSAGSTAMSATVNTVQELNITDTVLPPGDYLLGGVCSTTVGTCFRGAANADEIFLPSTPIYEEASGLPLPATCTPVVTTQNSPPTFVFGIQFRSVF